MDACDACVVMQKYTFKMHEPNSMDTDDMEWCPGLRQVDQKPIDEGFKFLFLLGAQKAGTTWLHEALNRHPIFVEANSAYRCANPNTQLCSFHYYYRSLAKSAGKDFRDGAVVPFE
jgi:hypothetical protein